MAASARVTFQIFVDVNILSANNDMKALCLVFVTVKYRHLFMMQRIAIAVWSFQLCAKAFVIMVKRWFHEFPFVRNQAAVVGVAYCLTTKLSRHAKRI